MIEEVTVERKACVPSASQQSSGADPGTDVDAFTLRPAGVSPQNSVVELNVGADVGDYRARMRISNADESIIGRYLWSVNQTPTLVGFSVTGSTAQGTVTDAFRYRGSLAPGEYTDFPLYPPAMQGPVSLRVTAQNLGALDTLVTLKLHRMGDESCN